MVLCEILLMKLPSSVSYCLFRGKRKLQEKFHVCLSVCPATWLLCVTGEPVLFQSKSWVAWHFRITQSLPKLLCPPLPCREGTTESTEVPQRVPSWGGCMFHPRLSKNQEKLLRDNGDILSFLQLWRWNSGPRVYQASNLSLSYISEYWLLGSHFDGIKIKTDG